MVNSYTIFASTKVCVLKCGGTLTLLVVYSSFFLIWIQHMCLRFPCPKKASSFWAKENYNTTARCKRWILSCNKFIFREMFLNFLTKIYCLKYQNGRNNCILYILRWSSLVNGNAQLHGFQSWVSCTKGTKR